VKLKNILLQAKWEIKRPLGSKSSVSAILLLSITVILLSILMPSFGSSSSIPVGEYKLYSVGSNDVELVTKLNEIPKIEASTDLEGRDAIVLIRNDTADIMAPKSVKGRSAFLEVAKSLKELNEKELRAEILANPDSVYVLKPIWVRILHSMPENVSGVEKEHIRENRSTTNETITNETKIPENKTEREITEIPRDAVTPSGIEIPLLFGSLVSSFTVVAPVFFFCLFFASSIIREKVNRRGTYLLSSPISSGEIIMGKLLPYFLAVLIMTSFASISMGKFSLWILITIAVITLAIMGISLIIAILSKSPEDMNFTLLFVNLIFFAYLFYPAMFSGIHPISMISPLSVMEESTKGNISIINFIFILSPVSLLAIVSILFGVYLFKDDVLFTQRSLPSIIYDLLQIIWIERSGGSAPFIAAVLSGILFIPVIYFIELAFLFLLFPLGNSILFFLVIIAAFAEETGKILGISALIQSRKIKKWLYGGIAGASFFLVEKSFVWAYFGFFTESGVLFLITKLLLFALFIHILCSSIAAYGFSGTSGRWEYRSIAFLLIAITIHAIFNFMVIWNNMTG